MAATHSTSQSNQQQAEATVEPSAELHQFAAQINAALPGTPDKDGWYRLSRWSPLLTSGLTLLVFLGIAIVNLREMLFAPLYQAFDPEYAEIYANSNSDFNIIELATSMRYGFLIIAGVALAVVVLVGLYSYMQWRFARYRVTAEKVELRQGILFKQQRVAPLRRIQGIDIERKLLAKLFRLSAVKITTAGGDFKLEFLAQQDAKQVREELLRLAHAAKQDAQTTQGSNETVPPAAVETPADNEAGAGVAGDGLVATGAGSAAAPTRAGGDLATGQHGSVHKNVFDSAYARDVLDQDIDAQALLDGSLVKIPLQRLIASLFINWSGVFIVLAILLSIGFFVLTSFIPAAFEFGFVFITFVPGFLGLVASIFGQLNKSWNYTITANGNDVRVGSGLTTSTIASVPIARINAVEVSQSLLWRPFGWYEVRFFSSGGTEMSTGKFYTALPIGTKEDVFKVLELLLDGKAQQADINRAITRKAPLRYQAAKRAAPLLTISAKNEGGEVIGAAPAEKLLISRGGFFGNRIGFIVIERAQAVALTVPVMHSLFRLQRVEAVRPGAMVAWRGPVRGLVKADAHALFAELNQALLEIQSGRNSEQTAASGDSTAPVETLTPEAVSPLTESDSSVQSAG